MCVILLIFSTIFEYFFGQLLPVTLTLSDLRDFGLDVLFPDTEILLVKRDGVY